MSDAKFVKTFGVDIDYTAKNEDKGKYNIVNVSVQIIKKGNTYLVTCENGKLELLCCSDYWPILYTRLTDNCKFVDGDRCIIKGQINGKFLAYEVIYASYISS